MRDSTIQAVVANVQEASGITGCFNFNSTNVAQLKFHSESKVPPPGVGSVTFENEPELTSLKTEEVNPTNKLAGAEFDITWSGQTEKRHVVTQADGIATCNEIPLSTVVTITETKAPDDYQTIPPKTVTSNSTPQVLEVALENKTTTTPGGPGFRIRKVDADSGDSLANATYPA